MYYYLSAVPGQYTHTHTVTHICRHYVNRNTNTQMKSFKHVGCCEMADKQVQTEYSVETLLNIANSSKLLKCGKCADLKLQLSQALSELSLVQLIVDLLNKEYKHKQDEQTFDMVRNYCWIQATSNHQKKPKIIGENSTHYIPTTTNRFELLSNLTKDADEYRPEKDTGKEPCSYSGCLQRQFDHKESISMGNYKANTKIAKHTCKKHDSAKNGNCRKQQPHAEDSTHRIPVLVNGLTTVDVSKKNICQKPKSSSRQNKGHKIVIISDSHARGSASNVKHNLNDNYRCSGFVRPGANIDTLTSSTTEYIKHLTNNDIIVFWGGTNDVSKNNSHDGLKHITNFVKVNSHTNIILMSVPH